MNMVHPSREVAIVRLGGETFVVSEVFVAVSKMRSFFTSR